MKNSLLAIAIILLLIIGCKSGGSGCKVSNQVQLVFESKSGSNANGSGTFTEKNGKVTFTASMKNLTPGLHAIHIHEKADCSAADASSAGAHWNPTFQKHGKWGSESYHRGDIGNFTADEKGNGNITFSTDQWCIGCADANKDILGKSIIVHLNPDDFVTQPTGNAGGRIACAAVIK
jgi:Cu-Zn family superoxide dismutase